VGRALGTGWAKAGQDRIVVVWAEIAEAGRKAIAV
jgi:hypothetical protein